MGITRTNEDKLDLLADIIEPLGAIISDRTWAELWTAKEYARAIQTAIRTHKSEIIRILARVDDVEPEDYSIDGVGLFFRLAAMLNRKDIGVKDLFTLPPQSGGATSSGPASETTGDGTK